MTGYTVHTGASKKFVSGWDKVFGSAPAEKSTGKSAAKAKGKSKSDKSGKGKKK
jgi:hypothetical protein